MPSSRRHDGGTLAGTVIRDLEGIERATRSSARGGMPMAQRRFGDVGYHDAPAALAWLQDL